MSGSVLGCLLVLGAALAPADEATLTARAQLSGGDPARLQHALARARRDGRLCLGVIGGSITQGAAASAVELRYGERLARWCREQLGIAEVMFQNAGIGATGSNYGALRAARDLLAAAPDIVVVEYGVNDANDLASAETVEGLVRQILRQPNQPAVILLYTMHQNGQNAQEQQSRVGAHYGLPQVSFRDALWPEIEAGRLAWEDVEADLVHPNDRGHELMARFVGAAIERVWRDLPADAALPAIPPLPAPLISDLYEHVRLLEAADLKPVRNEGWRLDPAHGWDAAWVADQLGSVIEFEVSGRAVCFMEWHVRGPMGQARIQVDDRPAQVVDAWFDQTWGGWRRTWEMARDLPPGPHRVRVELLESKHAESDGHTFRICGLGAAGVE